MHSNTGAQHMGQLPRLRHLFSKKSFMCWEQREEAVFMGYTMSGATLTARKAVFG